MLVLMARFQGTVEISKTDRNSHVSATHKVTFKMETWLSFFIVFIVMVIGSLAFVFILKLARNNEKKPAESNDKESNKRMVISEENDEMVDSSSEREILYFISFFASFAIIGSKIFARYYKTESSLIRNITGVILMELSPIILSVVILLTLIQEPFKSTRRIKSEFILSLSCVAFILISFAFDFHPIIFVLNSIASLIIQIVSTRILLLIALRYHSCGDKVFTNLAFWIGVGKFLSIYAIFYLDN